MKKRKEKRKYVARPGIEPRTPDLRVRCPTDCATRPEDGKGKAFVSTVIFEKIKDDLGVSGFYSAKSYIRT